MKHAGESPADFLSWACSCVLSNMGRAGLCWIFKAQDLKQKAKLQRESVARSYIIFINSLKSVIIFKGQEKDLCQLQRWDSMKILSSRACITDTDRLWWNNTVLARPFFLIFMLSLIVILQNPSECNAKFCLNRWVKYWLCAANCLHICLRCFCSRFLALDQPLIRTRQPQTCCHV